jgi:protein tyrosine phosphatase (PTP) superfamily phosphohydrolase (DUF442 family)
MPGIFTDEDCGPTPGRIERLDTTPGLHEPFLIEDPVGRKKDLSVNVADSGIGPTECGIETGVIQPVSMYLVEAKADVDRGATGLFMLPTQIVEQLGRGNGQISHPTLEEVPGERSFRRNNQIGRLRPAGHFPKQCSNPAEVLLVSPLVGPYLGDGEAEHGLIVSAHRLPFSLMSTPFHALSGVANACQILPNVITGGQPTAAQLRAFKQAGGSIVLDVRDPMEPRLVDEPALVRELGMEYVNIPVRAGALNDATLEQILSVLRGAGDRTVFFHCGSGNRVGGALIPYFILNQDMEEQDAVDQAMRVGLRSAEMMEWGLEYARRNRPQPEP